MTSQPPTTTPTATPTTPTTTTRTARAGSRRVLHVALLIAVGAAGVYAGVRWHAALGPRLGIHVAGSAGAEQPTQTGGAKQLWTCGMHPQVIQDRPGDCPICHMKLTPLNVDNPAAPAGHDHTSMSAAAPGPIGQAQTASGRKVKYWWDPMLGPSSISDKPGKSAMGMDLVPVYEDDPRAGGGGAAAPGSRPAVTIDPAVVQNMGVRTATVTEGPLKRSVRLVGYLDEAQPNIYDINLRVSGWVRRLHANVEGQRVEAGDPLFDLYSPELQVAVEELIAARRARAGTGGAGAGAGPDATADETADALYQAAARKLELFGLAPAQIEPLAKLDTAPDTITFVSPVAGDVTEKPIVEGAAVQMGERALRIVDRSTLWLDARVFEKDLPTIALGQAAVAHIASRPEEPFQGEVIFVYPRVDPMTRTTIVRLAIANPTLALRPGMYATVRVESQIADRAVLVPREAVIDTGESQLAFVSLGGGRFEPRKVRMRRAGAGESAGAGTDGLVQVVEGLSPGETVVTSGQFLLDSESRLREAIQKFLSQQAGRGQGAGAAPPPPPRDVSPAQQEKADAVVGAYLGVSAALGAPQKGDTPVDVEPIIAAAHALHGALSGTKQESLAADLAKAAGAMKGQPLARQRALFSALGEKVIALADAVPPSKAVAGEGGVLYVMHCPMATGVDGEKAKGDWVQTSPDVANPFFADEMKECGSLVRTITTREKRP
jgi:membrane fusion protein, copper/silver efflux system